MNTKLLTLLCAAVGCNGIAPTFAQPNPISCCDVEVAPESSLTPMQRREMAFATAQPKDSLGNHSFYYYCWDENDSEPYRVGNYQPQFVVEEYTPKNAELEKLIEAVSWIDMEAISLAIADMSTLKGFDAATAKANYAELKALCNKGFESLPSGDKVAIIHAKRAVELKRAILLSNPLLKDAKIVATKYELGSRGAARQSMVDMLGSQPSNWTSQVDARRSGFNTSIVEISDITGEPSVRELYSAPRTSPITDLRLQSDGDCVSFTQTQEDLRWNIYELNLNSKEVEKVVINDEVDLDFFDGVKLPDGRYILNSNIGYNGVPCVNGDDGVSNMMLYDPKTENLRQVTFDQDSNWGPAVMNNGRVMYTRWEYTDLTHYYTRIVMHMNPDGTENKALYGSGGMFPNSTFDVQPIPNESAGFIGVISGHHGVIRSGRLIIFDPAKGRKGAAGMVQEIPHRNKVIVEDIKDHLVNDVWPQFYKPTVVNENYFLVIAKPSPKSLWGVYLVDRFDNMTCLMQSEDAGYAAASLIKKRVAPPVIPSKINLDKKEATFFIQDIYEGEGLAGVPRGTIKELRLFAYEYAYLDTASDHDWQGIQAGWDIKRFIGSVAVEEDGSALFTAPANTPISIQPVDAEGVAVQWMRSWVVGQQGEVVSCIGCHEDQNQIAMPKRALASMKSATPLTEPEGGVRSFTFDLEIQPILDRACIACHNGDKAFSLKAGVRDTFGFGPSYMNLMPYVRRQGGEGDMAVLRPYEYHPNTSEVVRLLKKGHHNVKLTDKEWRTLYQWIGFNAPYKGTFDHIVTDMEPFLRNPREDKSQYYRRIELKNKYADGMGVDWKKELSDYADYLASKGKITPVMPAQTTEKRAKEISTKRFPFEATASTERKVVEVAPGVEINFVRIPAGEFVMGSNNGDSDARPVSKVKINKSFWMAELETTNEQMRALMDHDSKFVDQMWKDHVNQGYPANNPDQPAIRLSYNKAMKYCELLSKKTGLNVTLPTEAQWEWACRAGSDSDFWYGDLNTDFGTKENLADKTTLEFAVVGVDPQPMTPQHPKYKWYTYLPKEERVDDGELVMVGGKRYEANPFGLYNMHGNVAEWTRSDYLPYPYNEKSKESSEYKVVRGGSYFERPKYSTSHSRKYYYPHQSVFNVGFRLIIED